MVEIEPVAERRQQHRQNAGGGDGRLDVLLRRGMPGVVFELAHIGRDGDEGLQHDPALAIFESRFVVLAR